MPPKALALQSANAILRLGTMAVKMGLTLYMGRYFSLVDIGAYGLVVGAVSILSVFFGQNFAYIVNRDVVGASPLTVCHRIRDEFLYYGVNYIGYLAITIIAMFIPDLGIRPQILLYIFILTVLEGYGAVTYFNLNNLNCQLRANALFFIRAALWVLPVVGLCFFFPAWRTADTIFIAWIVGSAASLALTFWLWRDLPWKKAMRLPVDKEWMRKGAKTTFLVWLGMIGITAGSFIDRFVVEHYLSLEDVGVLTFYFSFTNALLTLMQSGVAAFATPRLIQHHRNKAHEEFYRESRQATRQITFGSAALAAGLGIAVPLLSHLLGKEAFVAGTPIFLMMLFATILRSSAEMKSNILFARHQDRAIWLGNILFLLPALGGNLLFVPIFGFYGIGYSAIIAAGFLLAWRWWHVRNHA